MTNARHGKHKLAKQTGTTAHFAQVTVRVEPSTLDKFTASPPADSIRGWEASALAGAKAAIHELRERGHIKDPRFVDITNFVGTPTDTSHADASWATFMAVFAAFPEVRPPVLEFSASEDSWVLSWRS
ncbi:hypothetical protein [Enhygromyxa salina]|uniref:hypothetical protein n=1 Tax=Enhygromyxa salina TaxID=215803 RepID=UPI000696ECD5|nr:hypothetical protein [Enhygromyxa salina]